MTELNAPPPTDDPPADDAGDDRRRRQPTARRPDPEATSSRSPRRRRDLRARAPTRPRGGCAAPDASERPHRRKRCARSRARCRGTRSETEVETPPRPNRLRRLRARCGARGRAGPRTVGRFIADALRAAGVRYAFTVPGESFLGLLDAFEAAGIRVIATRHEGAAAFMAEAHGQLTGRPAVCLGTRAVGGANLAIGIHTARQDSTPMFVAVGQVERRLLGPRGVPGDRPGRDAGRPRQVGRGAARRGRGRVDDRGGHPPGARWAAPGPVLLSLPEDLLDEPMPDDAPTETVRDRRRARDGRRDPLGHRAPRIGRAAGHPRRRRRPSRAGPPRS